MTIDLALVALALVATYLLTPLAARVGRAWKLVDQPDSPLKIHGQPTPRSGGLALVATMLVVAAAAAWLERTFITTPELLTVLLLFALGVWDDRRPRSPQLRLVAQVVIYAIAYAIGLRFMPTGYPVVDFVFGLVLFVIVVNAANFYDGMDGLLSLTAAGALGVWAAVALTLGADALVFGLFTATLLGFLPRNWCVARIFLGDGGSFVVGFYFFLVFTRAVESGLGVTSGLWVAAVPVCDAGAATIDRMWRRRGVWLGDRDHVYDVLHRIGWSVPRVALFLALIAALGARMAGWVQALPLLLELSAAACAYLLLTALILHLRRRFGGAR